MHAANGNTEGVRQLYLRENSTGRVLVFLFKLCDNFGKGHLCGVSVEVNEIRIRELCDGRRVRVVL